MEADPLFGRNWLAYRYKEVSCGLGIRIDHSSSDDFGRWFR